MAELAPEQFKSLEEIRQRLLSLNASLGALRTDLATTSSLPAWSSLQSHANLISSNLQQINTSLSEHQDLLASTIAFPSMQFPGRHQADVVQMLLRTKLEPDVEEWVEQGQKHAKDVNTSTTILRDHDREELWQWAPSAANDEARKQKWGADYTLAEVQAGVEKVITGLKRELIEPPLDDEMEDEDEDDFEEEEEEGEEEAMEVDVKPDASTLARPVAVDTGPKQMPMESVHRYMTTGKVG